MFVFSFACRDHTKQGVPSFLLWYTLFVPCIQGVYAEMILLLSAVLATFCRVATFFLFASSLVFAALFLFSVLFALATLFLFAVLFVLATVFLFTLVGVMLVLAAVFLFSLFGMLLILAAFLLCFFLLYGSLSVCITCGNETECQHEAE